MTNVHFNINVDEFGWSPTFDTISTQLSFKPNVTVGFPIPFIIYLDVKSIVSIFAFSLDDEIKDEATLTLYYISLAVCSYSLDFY